MPDMQPVGASERQSQGSVPDFRPKDWTDTFGPYWRGLASEWSQYPPPSVQRQFDAGARLPEGATLLPRREQELQLSRWQPPGWTQAQDAQFWLEETLKELGECEVEAQEEGMPQPSAVAKESAERILREIARLSVSLPAPGVYPTAEGEIAMSFSNRTRKSAVLVLCDGRGGAAWFSSGSGIGGRMRYNDATELPDVLLRIQLTSMVAVASPDFA